EDVVGSALGRPVHAVNDADAAGYAEVRYGAAAGTRGVVLVVTLGTGTGTALIADGRLRARVEVGPPEVGGVHGQTPACPAAPARERLSWRGWAERLQRYYGVLEDLLSPDLFVVGGGVSKQADQFLPLLDLRAPIVPARLRNAAGIVGAAALPARAAGKAVTA